MRKSINKGDLSNFIDSIRKAIASKENFKVVANGLSRKIIFENGIKYNFFGRKEKNQFVDGVWLTTMVRKEIDIYIEKNGIPELKPKVDVQLFNLGKINELALKKKRYPLVGVDINSCYWRTAYLLGYISEELYNRGLDTCKKMGLLVAIGCLNKRPIIKEYVNGEMKIMKADSDYYDKYSPFYWSIIYHTYQIMMEAYEQFSDDFVMYITDCLFVEMNRKSDAQKFFKERGYDSKSHFIDIVSFDGRQVVWYDTKANKRKGIYAFNRDISLENTMYRINKGSADAPPLPKLHIA
jgi:hypothetical protein